MKRRSRRIACSRPVLGVVLATALSACGSDAEPQTRDAARAGTQSESPATTIARGTATTHPGPVNAPAATSNAGQLSSQGRTVPHAPGFDAKMHALRVRAAAGLRLRLISAKVQHGAIVVRYAVTSPRPQRPGWPNLIVNVWSKGATLAGPYEAFADATGGQVRMSLPVKPEYDHIEAQVRDVQGHSSLYESLKLTRP